uniref:Differential display during development of the gonad-attached mesonephros n=1 Tax=Xenopus laevis TaxID=8355 RepID=Q8JIR7_XENLA|nr:Differential display during development of the gonad-attached mesonephros [Xenopus laevis]AAI69427.1 Differential display during development of the gonad-attached mesonephros [Xenopus laevis]BAC10685.1 MG [Xenopus laevis]
MLCYTQQCRSLERCHLGQKWTYIIFYLHIKICRIERQIETERNTKNWSWFIHLNHNNGSFFR